MKAKQNSAESFQSEAELSKIYSKWGEKRNKCPFMEGSETKSEGYEASGFIIHFKIENLN